MEEKKSNTYGILTLAIFILLGVAFLGALNSQVKNSGEIFYNVTGESGYINSTGYQLSKYSPSRTLGNVVMVNASDNQTISSSEYTINDTWYVFNATSSTYSQVNIQYVYSEGIPLSSTSKILLDILIGIFAVSIIAFIIAKLVGFFEK
jgi:hypothetical protein